MTMTTADIVATMAQRAGCSKEAAAKAFDGVVETITVGLVRDQEFRLNGIGRFKLERVEARQGRNPRNGEPLDLPAVYRVKFKPAKPLRDRLPAP